MADTEVLDLHDPHPSIYDLFGHYNRLYFEEKLGACMLGWSSRRMTACAGMCLYKSNGLEGCEIRLSEPLLKFRPVSDLKNTLLHEMIHAYLFLTNGNDDHDDHGPRFKAMMETINSFNMADYERPNDGYRVTIYHNFTAEVDQYRRHHWRCVNCSDYIKRAMNRTPSKSDCLMRSANCSHPNCHWHRHERVCGGTYEKVLEPEGYVDKRKRTATVGGSSEQKGQINGNRGIPKKIDKDGATPKNKIGSLDAYFVSMKKDRRSTSVPEGASEKDDVGEDPFVAQSTSPAESTSTSGTNGHVTVCDTDDLTRKTRISGLTDESREVIFEGRSYLCLSDDEELESEDTGKQKARDNHAYYLEQSAKPPISSRSRRVCNEVSEAHVPRSKRRRMKTTDEGSFSQSQNCKDPLVILAWANWVSYESDEEFEEPLINKRTERTKRVRMSPELSREEKASPEQVPILGRGRDDPQSKVLVSPVQSSGPSSGDGNRNDNYEQGVLVLDGKETDLKSDMIYIELAEDDGNMEWADGGSSCGKQQTFQGRYFHPKNAQPESTSQEVPTSPIDEAFGGKASETSGETRASMIGGEAREIALEATPLDTPGSISCPVCNKNLPANAENDYINSHIDECLARIAIQEM